jgi:hypothetical protein
MVEYAISLKLYEMRNYRAKCVNVLLASLFIFISCSSKLTTKHSIIYISYLKGFTESIFQVKCGDIGKIPATGFKVDTLIVDSILVNEIFKQVKIAKNATNRSFNGCGIRMDCKLIINDKDSTKLCIGETDCTIIDGEFAGVNDTLLYLIRKNTGYYNYFNKEELLYFKEIEKYGIPNDYKKLRNN